MANSTKYNLSNIFYSEQIVSLKTRLSAAGTFTLVRHCLSNDVGSEDLSHLFLFNLKVKIGRAHV